MFPSMSTASFPVSGHLKTMNEKKIAFDVYLLDVYLDEGGWIENERHLLGNMEVEPAIGKDTTSWPIS